LHFGNNPGQWTYYMPRCYVVPGKEAEGKRGLTYYRLLVGKGMAYYRCGDKGPRIDAFYRGASATVLAVEARRPVIWTEVGEIDCSLDDLDQHVGPDGRGFHALMADGTVRYFRLDDPNSMADFRACARAHEP